MIQVLRALFDRTEEEEKEQDLRIVLLYGAREVEDVLLREQIEEWQTTQAHRFRVVFCIGSRFANVHMGAKTKDEYIPPPLPLGFEKLRGAELGWINEDKISRHAFPPSIDTRVCVCGLPGVYEKLCGSRFEAQVAPGSALFNLGYRDEMVIKL